MRDNGTVMYARAADEVLFMAKHKLCLRVANGDAHDVRAYSSSLHYSSPALQQKLILQFAMTTSATTIKYNACTGTGTAHVQAAGQDPAPSVLVLTLLCGSRLSYQGCLSPPSLSPECLLV